MTVYAPPEVRMCKIAGNNHQTQSLNAGQLLCLSARKSLSAATGRVLGRHNLQGRISDADQEASFSSSTSEFDVSECLSLVEATCLITLTQNIVKHNPHDLTERLCIQFGFIR